VLYVVTGVSEELDASIFWVEVEAKKSDDTEETVEPTCSSKTHVNTHSKPRRHDTQNEASSTLVLIVTYSPVAGNLCNNDRFTLSPRPFQKLHSNGPASKLIKRNRLITTT
jgi:hypothetical protein